MKKIKSIMAVILCLMMVFLSAVPAMADVGDQAVIDARSGVVKVLVYYNKRNYPEAMGSGFLINEDTIVTAQHLVENEDGLTVSKVTVAAVGDIEIEAVMQLQSRERDFAIMKLKQKINQRVALPIGVPTGFDVTSKVYALGFPYIKELTSDKSNYAAADVTVTDGTVSAITTIDSVHYIQHGAKLDYGNSGGPLVYSDGKTAYVVGINTAYVETGSQYYYSVHADELIEALDTLGVEYAKTPITPSAPVTEAPSKDGGETESQTAAPVQPATPAKTLDGKMIGIIAGAAVLVIAIIVVIIVVMKKKSAPAPTPARPAGNGGFTPPVPPVAPQAPSHTMTGGNSAGSEGTTVLSQNMGDAGATTVLGASAAIATLVRLSNNEKISITKPYFKLGKDANRVDYCITGNPAVSRFHASIVTKNGQYFIVDNSTTNHTYVNDSMIPANVETQISNGAKIRLADEKFEFQV